VSHKKEPTYFACNFVKKSTDFNAVFTVRFVEERYMWLYELHLPHLINVATLLCESQNSWKCNVTVGYYQRKLYQMYRIRFNEMDLCIIKFRVLCSTQCAKQRFVTSMTCKTLYANLGWLWTERYRVCDWPVARPSEIMCACWWRTHAVNYCSFVLCGSSEHFWNCQCNLEHLTAIS